MPLMLLQSHISDFGSVLVLERELYMTKHEPTTATPTQCVDLYDKCRCYEQRISLPFSRLSLAAYCVFMEYIKMVAPRERASK